MLLVEIGTAGAISAYFYRHITSDPIERQPVQLSDYLFVFGCGLVFWLLVLLRAKLHGSGDRQADIRKVAKLAKLIAPITTLNLCGCLLAPFKKLPLLVRFLVLLQVSSNLALLLIWAFLSLKKCMIVPDARTHQQQKSSPEPQAVQQQKPSPKPQVSHFKKVRAKAMVSAYFLRILADKPWESGRLHSIGASGSLHGIGASGSEGGSEGGDSGSDSDWGGDRGASGSGHGIGASGSGGGHGIGASGSGGGSGDSGASGSGHGIGASGSGGGSGGGDRGRIGGGADLECGGTGTNTEQGFKSSKITEMSLMLTAQTTATLMGFHTTPTPSSSSKALLVVALMDQLVAYLCGLTSILLSSNKPEDSKAVKIFADIGLVCNALGFILMVAMYVPWYFVLIAVIIFGVVWLIFFRDEWKTRATKVWNYLRNSTQNL